MGQNGVKIKMDGGMGPMRFFVGLVMIHMHTVLCLYIYVGSVID